ncbi:MAG: torS [Bradyrhizobium sp.]|nr:torS [Bradyrhizobium sp.]
MHRKDKTMDNSQEDDVQPGTQPDANGAHASPGAMTAGFANGAQLPFPVVGIGSSAGGLEALTGFFEAMSGDSGMAFVVLQHLAPDRETLMPQILARHTPMPVMQIEDGTVVEPDHVYVIRPSHTVTLVEGRLRSGADVRDRGHRRPVDDFFRSLALHQRESAIAVILSGMGSNGTAGAQAVKAGGGVCIAENPATAKYSGMPSSLIHAGYADMVLDAADIARALLKYARAPYLGLDSTEREELLGDEGHLNEIRAILRVRTGHDFSGYKKATILRRVLRRMSLKQVVDLSQYAALLRGDAEETLALTNDLMISVTGFFRDPEAWETLRTLVIAPLVESRPAGQAIRAWTAACSSGEEPYSLAILLAEEAERVGKHFEIKIFATDAADKSLELARAGLYPGGIEGDVSTERLARYFEQDDYGYRVRKSIREWVVFAPHNVLHDAPFSRLDVCSCRNLLIYLEPETQRRLLSTLTYAVREGGALFLGSSETPGAQDGRYETLSKNWRIFRKAGGYDGRFIGLPAALGGSRTFYSDEALMPAVRRTSQPEPMRELLLAQQANPGVLVDKREQVIYFHGDTSPFLVYPPGQPTRHLFDIARPFLRPTVRRLIRAAMAGREEAAHQESAVIAPDENGEQIAVRVLTLFRGGVSEQFFISFERIGHLAMPAQPSVAAPRAVSASLPATNEQVLEEEVRRLRKELEGTVEAFQVGHEELKASNEEITSMNEELQSSNEELESSQEELHALNEELATVNSQLQAKIGEIEAVSNDLGNLLSNTAIAVLFLDLQMKVRRYTPAVTDLLNLIPADNGRAIRHLTAKFPVGDLHAEAEEVLRSLRPLEQEVHGNSKWYLKRILPYRTSEHNIEGVVITFVDISNLKRAERELEAVHRRQRAVLDQIPEAILIVAPPEGKLIYGNRRAAEMFGHPFPLPFIESEWRSIYHAFRGYHQDGRSYDAEQWPLYRALSAGEIVVDEEIDYVRPDGSRGRISVNASPVRNDTGEVVTAVATFAEITERTRARQALRDAQERFRLLIESAADTAIFSMDADGRIETWNKGGEQMTGWTDAEVLGQSGALLFTEADRETGGFHTELATARTNGKATDERWHRRKDGSVFWASGIVTYVEGDKYGTSPRYLKVMRDATANREAEEKLRAAVTSGESNRQAAERANRAKDDFIAVVSHELRSPLNTISLWAQILSKDQPKQTDVIEGVKAILRASQRQQQLIDDLLDVARMGTGKLRLALRPTRLAEAFEDAINSVRPAAQARGVSIESDLDVEVGIVRADPDRLEQVALNLLNNAVKFTPSGGRVSLRMRRSGETVEIDVTDSGIGIKAEFLDKIFNPFTQAEIGTARAHAGLGLGLAIAKQLIEQHNGTISVSSEGAGRGTTFSVHLPLPRYVAEAEFVAETHIPDLDKMLSGLGILVVEDEVEAGRAIAHLLERHGADVHLVESAPAARAAMQVIRPNVILSDIGLPGEDGYMFIATIRSDEGGRNTARIPAIALTAFAGVHDRKRALDAGFDYHLSKPLEAGPLLTLLVSLAAHSEKKQP